MQVNQRIHDGSQKRQHQREREALLRLLLAQGLQVPSLDVIHEQVDPSEFSVFEDAVHTWQRAVIQSLEDLPFEDEALAVPRARVDQLFEGEEILLEAPVSDQVDRARSPSAKETLDDIAVARRISYGDSAREQ